MKSKWVIAGAAGLIAIALLTFVLMSRPRAVKPAVSADAVKAGDAPSAHASAAVKVFSKDMGGLTVKLFGSNGKEVSVRIRLFKAIDSKSGVQFLTFNSNKMQELPPGIYDIEVDTVPAKIYKGINIQKGRETVEDLGCPSGALAIKTSIMGKKPAVYPVTVFFEKSNVVAAKGSARKAIGLLAGTYDVEIGSIPSQVKTGVKIEPGKETSVDIGASGGLNIKALDDAGKKVRGSAKIKRPESYEVIASPSLNTRIDIMPGLYSIEVDRKTFRAKKDVSISAGEEATVEFVVMAPGSVSKPAQPVSAGKSGE